MRFPQKLFLTVLFAASITSQAAYEAHEWGTFTSLVGSNGVTQHGMYHEDEPLPDFVHRFGELGENMGIKAQGPNLPFSSKKPPCRGKACFDPQFFDQNVVSQKMETPVIYFYTDQVQKVEVNVQFPEGVITDTYPGPSKTYPDDTNITSIGNGNTTFSVKVLAEKTGNIPKVDADNIYSHARNVDSNIVVSGMEKEKFIFYRGIGRFQPKLDITAQEGSLKLQTPSNYATQAAFLVHVDASGHGQLIDLGAISEKQTKLISSKEIELLKVHDSSTSSKFLSGDQARTAIVNSLIQSGLRSDEAIAMVDTWEQGYLKVPGLRLLYILPSHEVDQLLPLKMTPAPSQLVRSFVARIEILLDTEEHTILNKIIAEGSRFKTDSLGRFAEPILRRVAEVYQTRQIKDVQVSNLLNKLVETASVIDTETTTTH